MNWKEILKTLILALLPLLYNWIVSVFPIFPLTLEMFTEIVMWILGALIGWQALRLVTAKRINNSNLTQKTEIKKITKVV